jgi:predicted Zn-dependent protease with MMP-like domain
MTPVYPTPGWHKLVAAMRVPPEEFEALVEQALDGLPEEFAALLDNVAVMVEEEPDPEDLEALGMEPDEELFGLYQGVPLAERDSFYTSLPDRVLIYRGPILRACASRREVIREVRDTVIHELGHHFGLDEDEMPY